MKRMSTKHMINIFLNEPLNYERMLEIPTEELEFLKDECDSVMKDLKIEIIKEFESIKNVLDKMRELKLQLKKLKERREIYKTFISIDKNQSILSDSSINSNNLEIKHISLSQLFKDIEDDKLIDEPVSNPMFKTNKQPSLSKIVIPEIKTKSIPKASASAVLKKSNPIAQTKSKITPPGSGLVTPKIYSSSKKL